MTLSTVYRMSVSAEDALKLIEKYNPAFNEAVESEKKNKVFIIDGRIPHSILIEVLTDEGIGTMFVSGNHI